MGGFFEMPGILASKNFPDLRDWKGRQPNHFDSKRVTFDFTRLTALSSEPLVMAEMAAILRFRDLGRATAHQENGLRG